MDREEEGRKRVTGGDDIRKLQIKKKDIMTLEYSIEMIHKHIQVQPRTGFIVFSVFSPSICTFYRFIQKHVLINHVNSY